MNKYLSKVIFSKIFKYIFHLHLIAIYYFTEFHLYHQKRSCIKTYSIKNRY